MGLPQYHRLKRRDDFGRLYQKGDRFKSKYLTLRVLKRNKTLLAKPKQAATSQPQAEPLSPTMPSQPVPLRTVPTRIGITISLKVDKRSVIRNRIRRQIQAVFRQFLPRLAPNWDVLVVVHPDAVQCDYGQFLQELEQLLIKAEVIDGNPGGGLL